ncbi:MAG: LamG domain-containing protein [Dehalococcoidales bacterium]|nr:LamG domain-containing protein [Dehalococcoidales bacterium]
MNSILEPSLVLHLPLHKLDGASFISGDASGHPVMNSGAFWNPWGRSFDGIDDLIDCGGSLAFESQRYTLTCWFKTTASSPDTDIGHRLVNIARAAGGESKIALRLKNNIADLFWITPATSINSISTDIIVNNGKWHHLAGTTDGTIFTVYLDGDFKAFKSSELHTDYYKLCIGAVHTGTGPYNGTIGEVRVYDRVLSALEIQHDYLAMKQYCQ